MSSVSRKAELYLNGIHVGTVLALGTSDAWGFGHFTPAEAFDQFAPIFGAWSLLIHEDDGHDRAPREALEELRGAEEALDSLRVELHWLDPEERITVQQVNIDGSLVEWRH